ncbi:hypothetical protein NUW58_g9495 [Xylaria curta]|uniref:Uncharacterized protein n=1 Tax=Xylaria curta TaxID=42375 RepID=A0ACC1MVY6_9PEZI|nr:hypothetical protein NUW58_g9495 [Xylaria curta]
MFHASKYALLQREPWVATAYPTSQPMWLYMAKLAWSLVDVSSDDGSETIRAKTTWTMLLYLTSAADGVQGGETVFYPNDRKLAQEELAIAPETGMLLLHKHGDNCLLHEGREVVAGQKWIIRTDLCVRR